MGNGFKKTRPNTTCFVLHNAINNSKKRRSENLNLFKNNPFQEGEKLNRTNALKQEALKQGKPSNFLIFNPTNMLYFANFSGANALLIPEEGENILYVSGVNYEQAKEETKGLRVERLNRGENLIEKITHQISFQKFSVDTISVESWHALAKAIGGEEKIDSANNLIRDLRKIKDEKEIDLIRKACKLADIGIKVAAETIQPGIKEKEVAAEIEYAMRMAGSDGVAFETIVASGYCCAYPHGSFLERIIQDGDFVVVDLGAIYKNYRSDITRTFTAGKVSDKQTRIYQTVKFAQQKAYEVDKTGYISYRSGPGSQTGDRGSGVWRVLRSQPWPWRGVGYP